MEYTEIAMKVLNIFIDRFYDYPYHWIFLIILTLVSFLMLVVFILTKKNTFIFWGFAGIMVDIFGMIYMLTIIGIDRLTGCFLV